MVRLLIEQPILICLLKSVRLTVSVTVVLRLMSLISWDEQLLGKALVLVYQHELTETKVELRRIKSQKRN